MFLVAVICSIILASIAVVYVWLLQEQTETEFGDSI